MLVIARCGRRSDWISICRVAVPRNLITTMRRNLHGVVRWMKVEIADLEVESEDWRRLLLHQMCLLIVVSTDGGEENPFRLPSMRVVVV
ncbi:hypothetical protein Tco_1450321 [Tanacetum coccineum]